MKNRLKLIRTAALFISVFSCIVFCAITQTADLETEEEVDRASGQTAPLIGLSAFALLVVIGVGRKIREEDRKERELQEAYRHYEELAAMYNMGIQQAPLSSQSADDIIIERAKVLYQQGDIAGSKALLRTMPDNPTAQGILARMEQR